MQKRAFIAQEFKIAGVLHAYANYVYTFTSQYAVVIL